MKTPTRLWCRGVLLGLLALALVNPAIPWRRPPTDVVVLLDDSLSMDRTFADNAWKDVAAAISQAPAGSRFALVRFAAGTALETPLTRSINIPSAPPRSQPLDRSATHIEAALDFGLRRLEPGRAAAIVLISDGAETRGDTHSVLRLAQAAAVPVYGVKPAPARTADAWIAAVDLPDRTRLGQRLPVTMTLASSFTASAALRLQVNGEVQTEAEVMLPAGANVPVTLWLEPMATGPNRVDMVLEVPGDAVAENNRRSALVNVEGLASVIYLTVDPVSPPAATSLQRGGWSVRAAPPSRFLQQPWQDSAVIILDNIAVGDMPEQAWQALSQAVRHLGAGLIVLGGPRAFGAGGYRHSTLEALLPVTAEALQPQPSAAVLFVVDKSGSMDRGHNNKGVSRLALARQAVVETTRSLRAGDRVGLLAFDGQPRLLAPLGFYEDPARTLEQAGQIPATGGTRLRPALLEGLTQLAAVSTEQRLLALVTDGFVEGEDFSDIADRIAAEGITVIALAVGDSPDLNVLRLLTRNHDGVLLPVHDITHLPRLLRQAVEQRRAAMETGAIPVRQTRSLPWEPAGDWPSLTGYMVTKDRPDAMVYLRSEQGDPLLAVGQAGAGRVLALPGGLGSWAEAWRHWPDWGRFLGGVVEWVNHYSGDPFLEGRVQDRPEEISVVIDALASDGDWAETSEALVTLSDPAGRLLEIPAPMIAPGRYRVTAPVPLLGQYRATVRLGDHSLQRALWHNPADEFTPASSAWEAWLQAGLLRPWSDQGLVEYSTGRQQTGLRTLFLVLAAIGYLALVLTERQVSIGLAAAARRLPPRCRQSWRPKP